MAAPLKISEELIARIAPLADATARTPHAWMIEALEAQAIATGAANEIVDATRILQHHPLIGRPVGNLHELLISKGRAGYVALYRYLPVQDRRDILPSGISGKVDWWSNSD